MSDDTNDLLRQILEKLTAIEANTADAAEVARYFKAMKDAQGDAINEMMENLRRPPSF